MAENANIALNPWHPMTDPVDLKYVGKLGEESAELSSIVFRSIIQGSLDEVNPDTGVSNRHALENELADVRANSRLVIEHYGLDEARIEARAQAKEARLRTWHDMA